MASPAELDTSAQYMAVARRWFTEGWTGNLALADEIFSQELRTNGVHVSVACTLPDRPGRDQLVEGGP
jgi:hypothetical protein